MTQRVKLTNDQEKEICRLYEEEMLGSTTISRVTGISESTIRRCLDRNGVQLRTAPKLNLDEIKELYLSGTPIHVIAAKFKSSESRISKKIKEMGIEVKHSGVAKFDETIFDSIDNEEKAYWLGFVYADGYIATINPEKRNYAFEISLKSEDFEHLNKFNNFSKYKGNNVKISRGKKGEKLYERCRWGISNQHLWETLNSYGCTPRKSSTLKFPDESIFIESDKYSKEELIRHFIRGYFDGDGALSFYDKNHISPSIGIVGTKEFLSEIIKYIPEFPGLNERDSLKNVYTVNASLKKGMLILHYIYDNCTIYLDRKYQLFNYFCRSYEKSYELLEGKNGEDCDVNTVLNSEIAQGSESV